MAAEREPDFVASVGVYEPPMPWLDWWPDTTAGSLAAVEDDPGVAAEKFLRTLVGDQAWDMLPMRTQQQRRDEGAALLADLQSIRTAAPFDPAKLTIPVAVATGAETRPHHIKGTAVLAEALGVSVHTFEGAGHNGHQSHPGEFATFCRAVLDLPA